MKTILVSLQSARAKGGGVSDDGALRQRAVRLLRTLADEARDQGDHRLAQQVEEELEKLG